MTIACGFRLNDGFILGADTEMTSDSFRLKTNRGKILVREAGNAIYGFTGAGDASFVDMAVDKIAESLREWKPKTLKEARDIIEDSIVKIHERNIACYPSDDKPSFSLIVAARMDGTSELIRTNGTSVTYGAPYEVAGNGSVLAKFIADKFWRPVLDIKQGTLLAIYLLHQVRKYVPMCGGWSTVFSIHNDGDVATVLGNEYTAWENFFERVELQLSSLLVAYGRPSVRQFIEQEFDELRRIAESLPEPYERYRTVSGKGGKQ